MASRGFPATALLLYKMLLADLKYDLVLMRSDDSEKFAAYLYDGLTANNPYRKLEVFRYDDDVIPGSGQYNSVDCSNRIVYFTNSRI